MKLDRFINRPVLSTVISILIVILGLIGLATLPITQYPDIAPPTVSVRATYQGANAQTVLNSVIAPLEDQINGVENMMYMTSNASNSGSADISIYFKPVSYTHLPSRFWIYKAPPGRSISAFSSKKRGAQLRPCTLDGMESPKPHSPRTVGIISGADIRRLSTRGWI